MDRSATSSTPVKDLLLNRTIARNLVLLTAMTAVLFAVPFRRVWASEILLTWRCHYTTISPAGGPANTAACFGFALCYSEVKDSLSLISANIRMGYFCGATTVTNDVDIDSSSTKLITRGLSVANSNGLPVASILGLYGCDGDPPVEIKGEYFDSCDAPSISDFIGGFIGDGWLGGGDWGGIGDGCDYCSYNWMTDAQC